VGIHFNVETMQQKTEMTCVPTVIWMMHRWYLDRIGLRNNNPIFDPIVNASQAQIVAQELQLNKVGQSLAFRLNEKDIGAFVRNLGLNSDSIPSTPESFENQLRAHGPFVYIESIPNDRLPIELLLKAIGQGSKYSHAILITGIDKKHSVSYITFNDPATGLRHHLEFYDFVTNKHKPLRGLESSFIICLTEKI
jgi:hypothetical protein